MSQTILEKSQGEFNKIRNDEVVKGINTARDLDEEYAKQMLKKIQDSSKVTIQLDPIDSRTLRDEIKGDIENAERPEAAKTPQVTIGKDFTISDMQHYVNSRRQIERNSIEQQNQEIHHITMPEQRQDNNYAVRNDNRAQSEMNDNRVRNDSRVQVEENERG